MFKYLLHKTVLLFKYVYLQQYPNHVSGVPQCILKFSDIIHLCWFGMKQMFSAETQIIYLHIYGPQSFLEAFLFECWHIFWFYVLFFAFLTFTNNVLKTHTHCSLKYTDFIFLSHANQPTKTVNRQLLMKY